MAEPGGAIYDDGLVRAGHTLPGPGGTPAYLGYLFVEPKRHAAGLADLTRAEAEALGVIVTRLSRSLVVTQGAQHVYAFVLGDNLVSRYPTAPREFWGLRSDRLAGGPARRARQDRGGLRTWRAAGQSRPGLR